MSQTVRYRFSVNPATPPALTIDSGDAVCLTGRAAFADVRDIRDVPTPFTPACDGHPLAPIAGPVRVRGAQPGDAVAIDLLEIAPHGDGITAILRDFGVLRREDCQPEALARPVRGDPHAAISDGIVEVDGTVQVLGFGPTVASSGPARPLAG